MNSDPIGAVLFTIFAVLVLAAVTVLQTRHSGPEERDDRGAERASSWNKILGEDSSLGGGETVERLDPLEVLEADGLGTEASATDRGRVFCMSCGTPLPASANYCWRCGAGTRRHLRSDPDQQVMPQSQDLSNAPTE